MHLLLSLSYLIKWFFYKDVGLILFSRVVIALLRRHPSAYISFILLHNKILPQRYRSYLVFSCCHCLIVVLGLLLACYDLVLFIVLLRCFICMGVIQIGKADLISQKYQIMIISRLKNWSRRYSSDYTIKSVGFM